MVPTSIESNNNLGMQRFSHLDMPTEDENLSGITIVISICRFFDIIIDVDDH